MLKVLASRTPWNPSQRCDTFDEVMRWQFVWEFSQDSTRPFFRAQGNTEEELPEVILAGVRITNLDMMSAKPFDPTADKLIGQGG